MFPPTDRYVHVARLHHSIGDAPPGVDWLMATAARAAEVQQQLAEGGPNRDALVTLHAHHAVEDPRYDPGEVVADLDVSVCDLARTCGRRFAAEVALFRIARSLLDELTSPEPAGAPL
jgi:hypothetical protein